MPETNVLHKSGSKNVLRLNRSFPTFEGYNHISKDFAKSNNISQRKHFILIIQETNADTIKGKTNQELCYKLNNR